MRGAGGTDGGVGRFLVGLVMFIGGAYLLFQSIQVHSGVALGATMFHVGGWGVTSGMVLIPFLFGVGFLFYSWRNPVGWVLTVGSLVALVFGVLANVRFRLQHMSAFDLIVILTLTVGGIGLLLSSFRDDSRPA